MEVNSSPILGYQGEKMGGGGGKCPPIVFLEGANIHHYAFVEGAIILPCQLLGGQMSRHAFFSQGGRCPGGGGDVRLPLCISISSERGFLRFLNSISAYASVLDIFFIRRQTLAKTLWCDRAFRFELTKLGANCRGGSPISGKGVLVYKGGWSPCLFYLIFVKYTMKM